MAHGRRWTGKQGAPVAEPRCCRPTIGALASVGVSANRPVPTDRAAEEPPTGGNRHCLMYSTRLGFLRQNGASSRRGLLAQRHDLGAGTADQLIQSLQRLALFLQVVMTVVVAGLHAAESMGLQLRAYIRVNP